MSRPTHHLGAHGLVLALAALAPCGDLLSQAVWPAGYANVSGGATLAAPFTISSTITPARTRMVVAIEGSSLPFAASHPIAGLALRRDSVHGATYPAYTANVQVRIRSIADAASLTSAAHLVFTQSNEVYNGNVPVPVAAPPGGGAAPFALTIPFHNAWTYPGGDLAIEVTVSGPAGTTWRCDAVQLPRNDGGSSLGIGGGCATSAGDIPPVIVPDLTEVHPGGRIVYLVDRLPAPPFGGLVAFLIGTPSPGYSPGPQFDPSCQLFLNPAAFAVSAQYGNRTVNHARGELLVILPNAGAFAGLQLSSQGVYFDLGLTSGFPAGFTQATTVVVGALPPAAATFAGQAQWIYGSLPTGSVQGLQKGPPNHVPVIQFL